MRRSRGTHKSQSGLIIHAKGAMEGVGVTTLGLNEPALFCFSNWPHWGHYTPSMHCSKILITSPFHSGQPVQRGPSWVVDKSKCCISAVGRELGDNTEEIWPKHSATMAGEQCWRHLKCNILNINYCTQLKVLGYITVLLYVPSGIILSYNYCHKTRSNEAQIDFAEY